MSTTAPSGRHHRTVTTPPQHRVKVPRWAPPNTRLHTRHAAASLTGRWAERAGLPVRVSTSA